MREMEPEPIPSSLLPDDVKDEDLRQALLHELAGMESSDMSDEEVFQLRLSCILEDDESDASLQVPQVPSAQKQDPKPRLDLGSVQVTDIDDDQASPKTDEEPVNSLYTSRQASEDLSGDEPTSDTLFGFEIKKLKSSDVIFKRPVVVKRVEYSSDSSLDMSPPNSNELCPIHKSGDMKVVEVEEDDTLSLTPDNVFIEYDTSGDDLRREAETDEQDRDKTQITELEMDTTVQDGENSVRTPSPLEGLSVGDEQSIITQPVADTSFNLEDESKTSTALSSNDGKTPQIVEIYAGTLAENELPEAFIRAENEMVQLPEALIQIEKEKNEKLQTESQESHTNAFSERNSDTNTTEAANTMESEVNTKDSQEKPQINDNHESCEDAAQTSSATNSPVFERMAKRYFEKHKEDMEVGEEEEVPEVTVMDVDGISLGSRSFKESLDKKKVSFKSQESLHSTDSSKPPVPPETYLWEELRRMRVKGGYPWTYLDKAPYDEATWKKSRDHEYEPISPPPPPMLSDSSKTSIPENERHFIRIPLDNELVVQGSVHEEDEQNDVAMEEGPRTPEDMEVERIAAAQDLQDSLETRYLATTPTTTTASRTDCDVNTSMLDSSGLEDLPLNRGSRTKKVPMSKTEQMRAQAQGIHQKLRSQAGKLRSKLRSIPKPSFNLKDKEKEKPKKEAPEKPRFSLPQRPKFNLPERTKFKLPERPKFNLPERPKFSLPERPKFSFPDKSKFNLPQKAKLNLPSFSKSRTSRDGQQGTSVPSSTPRKNVFEFDFKTYPKMFNKKSKQRGDYTTSSPKQTRGNTPPPKMRTDDPVPSERKKDSLGRAKTWVNKFDDIQYADEDVASSQHVREPSRDRESARSERSESISDFRDKELAYTEDLEATHLPPGRRTISTKSSLSHLSDREVQSSGSSEDRHRKGVLEEIDSDQFFLRQKGISQEDIDMGKYLSEEIREAFRSPVVNALSQMDYDYEDLDVENIEPEVKEPPRPSRTRSLRKKSTTSGKSDTAAEDMEKYRTYPPRRPSRKSRSQSKSNLNEEGVITEKPRYENEVGAPSQGYENDIRQPKPKPRYENYPDGDASDYYKTPGPATEYYHYKVPRPDAPTVQPTPMKRKYSAKDKTASKKKSEGWVEVEIETSFEEIQRETPLPLQRKKSKHSLHSLHSLQKEEVTAMGIQRVNNQVPNPQTDDKNVSSFEPDYIIPVNPEGEQPVPPSRTRSLSRGRSARSLAHDESKTLQDMEREQNEEQVDEVSPSSPEEEVIVQEQSTAPQQPAPPQTHHYEVAEDDEINFGYATVGKAATLDRPERNKKQKPPRPPPPRRKRATPSPTFNTLPSPVKSSPIRPIRNYSTLGPSRPPRKTTKLSTSVEHIYTDDRQSLAYLELLDTRRQKLEESIPMTLQTDEVIEKMKVRPLPAPPRPPRQRGKGTADEWQDEAIDLTEEDRISMAVLRGEMYPLENPIQREVSAFVHAAPAPSSQGSVELVEEVCVSTQTDPLPEDYCVEGEDDLDIINEFSHEQLQIQEAFLEEMRQEEERIQKEMELKRRSKTDEDIKITSEVIKQIDEILAEEKKLLIERQRAEEAKLAEERERQAAAEAIQRELIRKENEEQKLREEHERRETESRQKEERMRRDAEERRRAHEQEEEKKKNSQLDVADLDMGYASLDRRQGRSDIEEETSQERRQEVAQVVEGTSRGAVPRTRQAPQPAYAPVAPDTNTAVQVLKTEKLQVQELEVARLNVNQLNANTIHVQNLTGNRLALEDIQSRAGSLTLGNIELPPAFIEQILARIPWDQLRPAAITASAGTTGGIPHAPTPTSTPVDTIVPTFPVPLRAPRRSSLDNSDQETTHTMPRRHRRLHARQHVRYSSDEDDPDDRVLLPRRTAPRAGANPSITELSQQLSRACTSAGLRVMRGFAGRVRPFIDGEDRSQQVKTILCIVLVMIAGYFLLNLDTKNVHHYHWDFQFPPQPPPTPPPQ